MKQKQLIRTKIAKSALTYSAMFLLLLSSCTKDNTDVISTPDNQVGQGVTQTEAGVGQGFDKGYYYSLWTDGSGSASITFPNANIPGNFKIDYSNTNNVVGGKGWQTGSSTRVINYNVGHVSGSYNFIGVYGWTKSPLIEYYVSEKGNIYVGNAIRINTVNANGHTYTFYKHQQVNKPSIQGTQTFWQYIDNWGGQTFNGNKAINMSAHVNNWRNKGGQGFGSHDYQVFGLEAYGNKVSGTINASVW